MQHGQFRNMWRFGNVRFSASRPASISATMQPIPPDRPDPSQAKPDQKKTPPGVPILRRTVARPPIGGVDPVDGSFVASRLTTLVHELSSLLDGSMRVVGLARRSLDPGHPSCPDQVARQLDTVTAAMLQMADLVRQSMIGLAEGGLGGMRVGFGACSSVADAVRHGVDVMAPLAEDSGIAIDCDVAPELNEVVAGPIYSVITNGVKNAIESIRAAGDREGAARGQVHVRAWAEPAGRNSSPSTVHIEIIDDGVGPPRADPAGPFTPGFSTKPGGSGIGLSLSRDILTRLGGTIELRARPRDATTGRAGAVLSAAYPAPGAVRPRAMAG